MKAKTSNSIFDRWSSSMLSSSFTSSHLAVAKTFFQTSAGWQWTQLLFTAVALVNHLQTSFKYKPIHYLPEMLTQCKASWHVNKYFWHISIHFEKRYTIKSTPNQLKSAVPFCKVIKKSFKSTFTLAGKRFRKLKWPVQKCFVHKHVIAENRGKGSQDVSPQSPKQQINKPQI